MWLLSQFLQKKFERLLNRFLTFSFYLIVLIRLLWSRDRGSCEISDPTEATARFFASSDSFSANSGASIPKYEETTVEKTDQIVFIFEWRKICCCLCWSYFHWIFLFIWMKCVLKSVSHNRFFLKNLKYEVKLKTFCQIIKTYVIQFIISILYCSNLIKKFFHFVNHCCDPSANHLWKSLIINF